MYAHVNQTALTMHSETSDRLLRLSAGERHPQTQLVHQLMPKMFDHVLSFAWPVLAYPQLGPPLGPSWFLKLAHYLPSVRHRPCALPLSNYPMLLSMETARVVG